MTNDDGRNDGTEGTEVPDGSGNGILASTAAVGSGCCASSPTPMTPNTAFRRR